MRQASAGVRASSPACTRQTVLGVMFVVLLFAAVLSGGVLFTNTKTSATPILIPSQGSVNATESATAGSTFSKALQSVWQGLADNNDDIPRDQARLQLELHQLRQEQAVLLSELQRLRNGTTASGSGTSNLTNLGSSDAPSATEARLQAEWDQLQAEKASLLQLQHQLEQQLSNTTAAENTGSKAGNSSSEALLQDELQLAQKQADALQAAASQGEREVVKLRAEVTELQAQRGEAEAQAAELQRQNQELAAAAAKQAGGAEPAEPHKSKTKRYDVAVEVQNVRRYLRSPAFQTRLAELQAQGGGRRGLAIPAGGRDMLANAYVTLDVLRNTLNCTLPVEVVYLGAEEMSAAAKTWLEGSFSNVTCVDASARPYPPHHRAGNLKSFAFKAYALTFATSFAEVLILDSDNTPLINPEGLFEAQEYKAAGNLFWPDFWHNAWIEPEVYGMFGVEVPWEHNPLHRVTESGQMLVDRVRHADVLEFIWYLNSHSDFMYKMMHGDKDTYRLAFMMAGKGALFQQVARPSRDALHEMPSHEYRYHHLGMVQHTPAGGFAFLHRTATGKFFPRNTDPSYITVDYLTIALSNNRASGSFKPYMYAWFDDQIDTQRFGTCPLSRLSDPVDPATLESQCGYEIETGDMPVPAFPVRIFGAYMPVLDAGVAAANRLHEAMQGGRTPLTQLAVITARRRRRHLLQYLFRP